MFGPERLSGPLQAMTARNSLNILRICYDEQAYFKSSDFDHRLYIIFILRQNMVKIPQMKDIKAILTIDSCRNVLKGHNSLHT